jgi:hypothetical protein
MEEMEYPPLEGGFDEFGEPILSKDWIMSSLLGTGVLTGAKLVNDLTNLIPWPLARPAVKLVVGLVGGRVAWKYSPVAGVMLTSHQMANLLYDDLLKGFVFKKFGVLPQVFGAVSVEERQLLGQLTEEEKSALLGLEAVAVEERQLAESYDDSSTYDDDGSEEIVLGNFNQFNGNLAAAIA